MEKRSWGNRASATFFLFIFFASLVYVFTHSASTPISPADCLLWIAEIMLGAVVVVGFITKLRLWSMVPRWHKVEPMSPEEFAEGRPVSRAPLPEVGGLPPKTQPVATLDFNGFEVVTNQLTTLGFQLALQGSLKTNRPASCPTYVRMFEHSSGAFAMVHQMFLSTGKATPLSLSVFSYYSEQWSVTDTNQPRSWVFWILCRPRALSKGHERTATVHDIWNSHLNRRSEVEKGLGLQAEPHSAAAHLAKSNQDLGWIRAAFLRRSILLAMIRNKYFRLPDREWWGEFHKFAKS